MRCKNCKEKFEPLRFNHKFCLKDECVRAFVAETNEKLWKHTKVRMQNDLKTNTDWLKEAQKVFNTYIRLRDKGLNCISCNKQPKKENCGHFYSQGGHANVRFDEENCHLQCEHCNTFLSGNLLNYREGLLKRIGEVKLDALGQRANITRKFTSDELKELIKKYKQLCLELK